MKSDTKHKVMDISSNSSEDLNDMHITKHAKLFAPMPNGIIMIPEDAFNRAL
ncbi:MAG TPA: hypothetical protein VD651_01810 [Nitrosarchaeum sp.]|nr:hypothetical protein [Nitrosarchaeum sp.]